MLNRTWALAEKRGYRKTSLALSASAAAMPGQVAGIENEMMQLLLVCNFGVAEGRLTEKRAKEMGP